MSDAPVRSRKGDNDDVLSRLEDTPFLAALRKQMLIFAKLKLPDQHMAEDAVQEALVGALRSSASFGRRAALKTWVFSILKNKIADILRKRHRVVEATSLLHDGEQEEDLGRFFDSGGSWYTDQKPAAWSNPVESVKNEHFHRVFEACLNKLPETQARIFMMREFVQLESQEICQSLGITAGNLHVLLYRARLGLRECLEDNWFMDGDRS